MAASTAYSYPSETFEQPTDSASASDGGQDSRQHSEWARAVNSRFSELAELSEDWDSHGGRPVEMAVMIRAAELLAWLGPSIEVPDILPLSNGGLVVEWESHDCEVLVQLREANSIAVAIDAPGDLHLERSGMLFSEFLTDFYSKLVDWLPRSTGV